MGPLLLIGARFTTGPVMVSRSLAATVDVDSTALYVPVSPAPVASFWQRTSAPARPPRFAFEVPLVTKIWCEALPVYAVERTG